MKIGEKLRKIRDFYGYTQQFVADEIGVSTSQYCKYEKDETPVTIETLEKISAVYKLTQVDILSWDERQVFNFMGAITANHGGFVNQQTLVDDTSTKMLIAQLQEEISYLKAENKRLWDLLEKLNPS